MTDINTSVLLDLRKISKVYFTEAVETHALSDVGLMVQRGEYLSISGPSGCGKSTLLAVLGLLDKPTSGSYRIDGVEVDGLTRSELTRLRGRRIGFVFQSFHLVSDLNVVENVELPLRYRPEIPRAERRQRAEATLEQVGLGNRMKHFPHQLSGGQQQRVAIARALVGSPALLLADEPTGNLDSKSGGAVMDLLDDLYTEGTTLCVVTHDENLARRAARCITMLDGRVVAEGLSAGKLNPAKSSHPAMADCI